MAGYTKELLMDAFLWRYTDYLLTLDNETIEARVKMYSDHYDKVGRDKFREYASLDAEAIRKFRLATGY